MQADYTMIKRWRTLYQLTVDDPTEHLKISFNLNLPWDLISLFLILKGTLVA
jgi:sporulation-control protein spo0M